MVNAFAFKVLALDISMKNGGGAGSNFKKRAPVFIHVNTQHRKNVIKYRECSEGVDKLKRAYTTINQESDRDT